MPDPARFMTEVLAMWTEADPDMRRAAIEAHFLDEVRLSRPDGEFTGHDALERFRALQRCFPGARFTLAKPPQQFGDAIRAYWFFGSPGKPAGGVRDGLRHPGRRQGPRALRVSDAV